MHEIVKCKECDKIIRQCRCFAKDKPVVYELCSECIEKLKELEKDYPSYRVIENIDDFINRYNRELSKAYGIESKLTREDFTCHKCDEKNTCKCAYDLYNQNGDCLASK